MKEDIIPFCFREIHEIELLIPPEEGESLLDFIGEYRISSLLTDFDAYVLFDLDEKDYSCIAEFWSGDSYVLRIIFPAEMSKAEVIEYLHPAVCNFACE